MPPPRFERKSKISFFHSIRVRVLVVVIALMVIVTSVAARYTLQQFEAATTVELQHEGILLSDALEAGITALVEAGDIKGIQTQIDRLVASRTRNDIEINIMLLQGNGSAIVASNIPDNIEKTSPEEHASLLASLNNEQPVVSIDREDEDEAEEEDSDLTLIASMANEIEPAEEDSEHPSPAPSHPDFYLAPGERFLSITTPLIIEERKLGSINVKLSLARIDQELAAIRWTLQITKLVELLLVTGGLILLLNTQVFGPLQRMVRKMRSIGEGDLSQRISWQGPINEMGWLANTFDRMLEQLQAAFTREKRFTADVAHELRTPLTALKGRIGVTLANPRTPAEYITTLEKLEKEVDRLSRLSTDLLFLARLEQGQLQPSLEEQDLSSLLEAIVDQMQPLVREKRIHLTLDLPPKLAIQGDADYLIRLFMNLIDNAIKYTPREGQVTIQAKPAGQEAEIRVSDTGPGIPPEHLPLIFDRFYRVRSDRSRGSGGAGLGLTIAHEIARAHRGRIEVQSELGDGTTFIVYLRHYLPGS